MNALNRIITVVVLVIAWVVVVFLAALPEAFLAWAEGALASLEQMVAALAALQPAWMFSLMRVGAVVLVTIVVLALLWVELRPRGTPAVRVQLETGGRARVTAQSVAHRLAWHIDQLADVISVEPEVHPRGSSVDVHLMLETAPDVEVPMKTEEVMAVAREVIEDRMGLQLRKLTVDIRHRPFEAVL